MIDSGSQSTACCVDFAKDYATDDSDGKKFVDVKFHGQSNEAPVPASMKVDVSDVASKVAPVNRLLKAGFDLHFTNHGPPCWMENGGLKTAISEDSATSGAPLHTLDVEVSPPPGELSNGNTAVGPRVAPITAGDVRLEKGSRVELAGLVQDMGLNGQRGVCMGAAPIGERWLIALLGGRRVNMKLWDIKPAGGPDAEVVQREASSAVPKKGPEDPPVRPMIEAHNLTRLPAAPWCEICVQARGKSHWQTQVKYDSEVPCV